MHPQLEQQIRLCIRDGALDPDLLVRLIDTSYREDDSRIHMLLDRLDECILITDENYKIVDANPAGRKLMGIAPGPLGEYELQELIPSLKLDTTQPNVPGAILAAQTQMECRRVTGNMFTADVNVFILKVGEVGKRICSIRKPDVAAAQGAEENTANTDVKPTDLSSETEAADQHAQDQFLAVMSHELRTPMNAVLGMAKHLVDTKLDEEQCESVKTIIDAGEVMMSLLNDLLDKSKIDAGKFSLEILNVDLRHTLRKLVRLWRSNIEKKGLSFSVQIADSVPAAVRGDSVRIRQILSNLLSNAAKFTSTGAVTLEVDAKPDIDGKMRIEFAVRDTGIGMNDEVQGRLFEAYQQASSSTGRQYGGTGLGLSISKNLAQMMNGNIEVESKAGLGSVFRFFASFDVPEGDNLVVEPSIYSDKSTQEEALQRSLEPKVDLAPAPKPVLAAPSAPSAPSAPNPASSPMPPVAAIVPAAQNENSLRILAVEDNPINQRVLAAFLRPIGGEVVWAGHGKEALEILETSLFDVVLMDIQMPIMDGLEATKALRASNSINVAVPVIAMTANAMLGDRETCLEAGMNDYVSKPIDPKTLYKSISRLVDMARSGTLGAETAKQKNTA